MKLRYAVFLSLLGLSVVSAAKMHNVFGRMPLCLIISIVLFSAAYAVVVYNSFSFIENKTDKECTRKKTFHYRFNLVNDSPLFFTHISAVFFNGCGQTGKELAVKPHAKQTVELDYSFKHIGKYNIGFLNARIYDLLNLFYIPYRNYHHEVIVIPRIENISRFIDIRRDEESLQSLPSFLRGNNSGDFDAVRQYVPGDSLKRIHWKLTAHAGKYMSRISEKSGIMEISVFIDLYKPKYTGETALGIFDCVVESALAAANYGIKQNCKVNMVFSSHKQTVIKTVNDFTSLNKAAENFALCGNDASSRIENLVDEFRRRRSSFLNFVICTPNLSYDLAYYIAELKSLGKTPVLFYILPAGEKSAIDEKITEYIENSGIDMRKIPV